MKVDFQSPCVACYDEPLLPVQPLLLRVVEDNVVGPGVDGVLVDPLLPLAVPQALDEELPGVECGEENLPGEEGKEGDEDWKLPGEEDEYVDLP